jgi:twitching motility protein PilT
VGAQLLLPRVDKKGRALAAEVLVCNTAARTVIRENQMYKLQGIIQTGRKWKMQTMDESLRRLYEEGEITYDTAVAHARDEDAILGRAQFEFAQ